MISPPSGTAAALATARVAADGRRLEETEPTSPPENGDDSFGSARRIVRNSTFNLVAQGANAAFYVVIVLVLARGLGSEGLGEFYALFAWVTVFQLVLEAGTSTVLTRRLVQNPQAWDATVEEAATLFAGISVASFVAFLGLGGFWVWWRGNPDLWAEYAISGVTCAAIQAQRYPWGVFRAREMFGYENASKVIQGFVFACLAVGLVALGRASLLTILLSLAISQIVTAAYLLDGLYRHWPKLAWRFRRPRIRSWIADTLLLGVGDVVRQLTWQIDTVLLSILQAPAIVGIYSLAYRPLGPINWLPRAVLTAAFPSLARQAIGSLDGMRQSFGTSIRLLWILSLPIAVAAFYYADPVVRILAGANRYAEFAEAAQPLRILIWITLMMFLSTQFRFVLAALGNLQSYTGLVVLVFFIELGLEAALIPWWSYFGACAGSVAGELVFTILGLALCRRLGVGSVAWRPMAAAALAACLMAGLLVLSGRVFPTAAIPLWTMIAVSAAATVAYFGFCVLFRALRWAEIKQFAGALFGRRRLQVPGAM